MIRGVGEDTLSPTLRDIEREREEGHNGTRHTVVTPSLCGVCWCSSEALKVKNFLYD